MLSKKNKELKCVLGLTGGIGSGKTTVLSMIKKMGVHVIDSDTIVHNELKNNQSLLKKIRKKFGPSVFERNGTLNRKSLGHVVFRSTKDRRYLEKLIHPLVRDRIQKDLKKNKSRLSVVDVPLLYESGWNHQFDAVIVVAASQKNRILRLKKRGLSLAEIKRRLAAQMPLEKKLKKADFVIDNNHSLKETKEQIQNLFHELRSK